MRDFLGKQPKKSAYQRIPETARLGSYLIDAPLPDGGLGSVQSLALRLRTIRAHTKPYSDEAVLMFFRTQEDSRKSSQEASWSWEGWYACFPAERCTLPHIWRPGYGQQFNRADLKLPDRQVIAGAVPLQYVLGAIKITDGSRFVPHLRPNRRKGETLAGKLWALVHALRAQYAGTPILLD